MDKHITVRPLKQNFALTLICSWHSLGKQDAISGLSKEKRRPGFGLNPSNIPLFWLYAAVAPCSITEFYKRPQSYAKSAS